MTDFVPTPPVRMPDLDSTAIESERAMQEVHAERRAYLEEVEDAVAETEASATRLDMRLLQLGNRSVEVDVEVTDRQIRGRVIHVSGDLATIETIGGGHFVVRVDRIMSIRFSGQPGETRGVETGAPSTIIARLREIWTSGERCTIGRVQGAAVLGDIGAVSDEHIEITDPQGTTWLVPIDVISWVGPKL